jgi:hypothetical protein
MFSRVSDSGGVKTFTFIAALLLSLVSLAFVLPTASTNLPAPAKINVTAVEGVSSGDTLKPITMTLPLPHHHAREMWAAPWQVPFRYKGPAARPGPRGTEE